MANGPVIPSGYYYTPALRNRGAEGVFEGILGGLDRVYAQDMQRERLRAAREARNLRNAQLAGEIAGGLDTGDPLQEMLLQGSMQGNMQGRQAQAGRSRQSAGMPRRSAGMAGATQAQQGQSLGISDARNLAAAMHDIENLNRTLAEYDELQRADEESGGYFRDRARIATSGADAQEIPGAQGFSNEEIARQLQRDASMEDAGTRALRDALIGDAEAFPEQGLVDDGYRGELAGMSDERFAQELPDTNMERVAALERNLRAQQYPRSASRYTSASPMGGPTDQEIGREVISEYQRGDAAQRQRMASADTGPEGFSDAPFSSFAQSLSAPVEQTAERRDRQILRDAYRQMNKSVADEAAVRAGMTPQERDVYMDGKSVADLDLQVAEESLSPEAVALMGERMVKPPEYKMVGRTDGETAALQLWDRKKKEDEATVGRATGAGFKGGLWNPAVDLGLDKRTILDPKTLATLAELEGAGDPRANRIMKQYGMDLNKSKKKFREGVTGEVVSYRGELADAMRQEMEVLEEAGASPEELAKIWLTSMNRRFGEKTFDVENSADIQMGMMVLGMSERERLDWIEGFDNQLAQSRSLERTRTSGEEDRKTKRLPSLVLQKHLTTDKEKRQILDKAFSRVLQAGRAAVTAGLEGVTLVDAKKAQYEGPKKLSLAQLQAAINRYIKEHERVFPGEPVDLGAAFNDPSLTLGKAIEVLGGGATPSIQGSGAGVRTGGNRSIVERFVNSPEQIDKTMRLAVGFLADEGDEITPDVLLDQLIFNFSKNKKLKFDDRESARLLLKPVIDEWLEANPQDDNSEMQPVPSRF